MLRHEGHFVGVSATNCPVCGGHAELAQLVNDEVDQIVSEFTVCPQCGTFPLHAAGSGYIAPTSDARTGVWHHGTV